MYLPPPCVLGTQSPLMASAQCSWWYWSLARLHQLVPLLLPCITWCGGIVLHSADFDGTALGALTMGFLHAAVEKSRILPICFAGAATCSGSGGASSFLAWLGVFLSTLLAALRLVLTFDKSPCE
jgi:hypothetical protein